MINRVLIRNKVVQVLYSCLLVSKKFQLAEPPAQPTKEKRYAYGLYVDMLALFVMLARRVEFRKSYPLETSRFMERIKEDDRVSAAVRRLSENPMFVNTVDNLAQTLKDSGIFRNYIKDSQNGDGAAEDTLWRETFNQLVMLTPAITEYAESLPSYTFRGMERMQQMMNETLSDFMSSQESLNDCTATLLKSLDATRQLYIRLLALAVDLTDFQERKLDEARNRAVQSPEALNPNMRFVDNRLVKALRENPVLVKEVNNYHINWMSEDPLLMESLLRSVLDSDIYKEYMERHECGMAEDAELWKELFRKVIFDNTALLEWLEETSVFWNDDIDIIGTFVIKTLRRVEEGDHNAIMPQFKDDEDREFGPALLKAAIKGQPEYNAWIQQALRTNEWEADRLAFMDVVIMTTALAEILNFPKIPVSVSINEYIEIAKCYSSAKSGSFINGLLADILRMLKEKGILHKAL